MSGGAVIGLGEPLSRSVVYRYGFTTFKVGVIKRASTNSRSCRHCCRALFSDRFSVPTNTIHQFAQPIVANWTQSRRNAAAGHDKRARCAANHSSARRDPLGNLTSHTTRLFCQNTRELPNLHNTRSFIITTPRSPTARLFCIRHMCIAFSLSRVRLYRLKFSSEQS